MKVGSTLVVATALLAASCGGANEAAVIERQAPADGADDAPVASEWSICDDVEAFARGSHAGDDLEPVLDEMARLAAVLGANDALPHLDAMATAARADESMAHAMDAAAEVLDRHGVEACGIPVFTAMYVSTSFSSCFGRAPIAAGTMVPDSGACETDISPPFLPCFDETQGFIPVDCRTGEPVVVRDRAWEPA